MNGIRSSHLYCALAVLTVIAYIPVWNNDLIDYDDEIYITRNANVTNGLSLSSFVWALTNDEPPYRMPVAWLTLQFDAEFFSAPSASGERVILPAAIHGQNLFWHIGNVLLLFALLQRLTSAVWRSFLAACLFAVHPMHVESVAWAIERKDVLMCFFGLLTIWAYVRHVEKPGGARYLILIASYLLSLLSKPTLITLPFLLLLLDYWPLRRIGLGKSPIESGLAPALPATRFRQLLAEKLSLFGIASIAALETMRIRSGVSFGEIPMADRLMNALAGYGWYLSTTLIPVPLVALYPHPHSNWSLVQVLAGAGLLVTVTTFALVQARSHPWLIVGWLWFVGTLLPVIGLAQGGAQAWADRFSYWPHIGLFVAISWGCRDLAKLFRIPPLICGIVWSSAICCLAGLTWVQIGYWRDSIAVWEHTLAFTEHNDVAHQHLANCYRKAGRLAEAESQVKESRRIQTKRLQR